MTPFHFGTSQKTLFGILHPPQAPARPLGVVLCNPMGNEAVRAHRAYQKLAVLLARARFHVLRFDYYGTGDSGGQVEEGDLVQWTGDIGTAVDELKDTTGVSRVSLVGLRLGATLSLLAAARRRDIDTVVLWDPVVSGAEYVRELRAMHREHLAGELGDLFDEARVSDGEALGFPLSGALLCGLLATDLLTLATCPSRKVEILLSQPSFPSQKLGERLTGLGAQVVCRELSVETWNSDAAINSALVPNALLQTIVAGMS